MDPQIDNPFSDLPIYPNLRDPLWRQDRPGMQIVSLTSAIEGDFENLIDGKGIKERQTERIRSFIQQLYKLAKYPSVSNAKW